MNLDELRRNWQDFGKRDPFWAILTLPDKEGNKWDKDAVFATGKEEIRQALDSVSDWESEN